MGYRAKSHSKVLKELQELSLDYGIHNFRFNDYILPHQYYSTLLPQLVEKGRPYRLGCELKANVNRARLNLLWSAGFEEVQPGIESFSTRVLQKMSKGSSASHNVRFLVNAFTLGISVNYNFLFGFPSDEEEDYLPMTELFPSIYHLQPPIDDNGVVLTRFSPMQMEPEKYGFTGPIRHDYRYEVLFSEETSHELQFYYEKYCYYFESDTSLSERLKGIYAVLRHQIQHWKAIQRARGVMLTFELFDGGIRFLDSRLATEAAVIERGPLVSNIYSLAWGDGMNVRKLHDELGSEYTETEIKQAILDLRQNRLCFVEDETILPLAIPKLAYEREQYYERTARWISTRG